MSNTILTISALSALTVGAVLSMPNSAHSQKGNTIEGEISFTGSAPTRKSINTSSDSACKSKALNEEVIVTKGKLKDVHVRIKSGTAGKHTSPKASIKVVQDGCVYRPHVVGAMFLRVP